MLKKRNFILILFSLMSLIIFGSINVSAQCNVHTYLYDHTVRPTCVSSGYNFYRCRRCGHTYCKRMASPLGHNWQTSTKKATCTQNGYEKRTCSRCGTSHTTIYTKKGHTWGTTVTKPATCTENGYKKHTCSNCGKTETTETYAAKGHTWGTTVTKPATCTENGCKKHTCSNCGKTKITETYAAKGHNWQTSSTVSSTCTKEGHKNQYCTRCKKTRIVSISAKGHNWKTTNTIPATCAKKGSKKQTCTRCGKTRTVSIPINNNAHKFVRTNAYLYHCIHQLKDTKTGKIKYVNCEVKAEKTQDKDAAPNQYFYNAYYKCANGCGNVLYCKIENKNNKLSMTKLSKIWTPRVKSGIIRYKAKTYKNNQRVFEKKETGKVIPTPAKWLVDKTKNLEKQYK